MAVVTLSSSGPAADAKASLEQIYNEAQTAITRRTRPVVLCATVQLRSAADRQTNLLDVAGAPRQRLNSVHRVAQHALLDQVHRLAQPNRSEAIRLSVPTSQHVPIARNRRRKPCEVAHLIALRDPHARVAASVRLRHVDQAHLIALRDLHVQVAVSVPHHHAARVRHRVQRNPRDPVVAQQVAAARREVVAQHALAAHHVAVAQQAEAARREVVAHRVAVAQQAAAAIRHALRVVKRPCTSISTINSYLDEIHSPCPHSESFSLGTV